MAKARSGVVDYAVYLLVRMGVCLLQALSYETACQLGAGLAWLAYRIDCRHRAVATENLQHAFPGRFTPEETAALVRGVYQHFCRLLVEIVHLPRRMHANNWRQYMEVADGRKLVSCLLSGRPLLFVTGHFGNWEMAGYVLGLLGFTTHAVVRPLDNRFLNDYLRRFRESRGQKLLAKKGDFEQMQVILERGGVIGTLADQDAGRRGLFVEFFHRPASTHKAIALLALEHRVPVVVVGTARVGEPMRHRALVEDVILPEEYDSRPDAVRAMTQRFTSALERIIRRHPEQYFWLHRRWKHQPAKSRGKVA